METRHVETVDGITENLIFHADGSWAIHRTADVEPSLDANKRLYNEGDGYSRSREWKRVASIPTVVQFEWIRRYGADPLAKGNDDLLRRVLNDPDWRYLRTAPGMI